MGAARTLAFAPSEVGSLRRVLIAGAMCPDSQLAVSRWLLCCQETVTGKGDSRETSHEQRRWSPRETVVRGGRNRGGEKSSGPGYKLRVEATEFSDWWDLGCERKTGVENASKVFGQNSWRDGGTVN